MTLAIILCVVFALGIVSGMEIYYVRYRLADRAKNRARLRAIETPSAPTLYQTMSDALDQIQSSLEQLNPPHPKNCDCVYCEIKYGKPTKSGAREQNSVYDKDTGEIWHPEYIRQLTNKVNTLQARNKELRAEVEENKSSTYRASVNLGHLIT